MYNYHHHDISWPVYHDSDSIAIVVFWFMMVSRIYSMHVDSCVESCMCKV